MCVYIENVADWIRQLPNAGVILWTDMKYSCQAMTGSGYSIRRLEFVYAFTFAYTFNKWIRNFVSIYLVQTRKIGENPLNWVGINISNMIDCNDFGYCHRSTGLCETKELRWGFWKDRDMWSSAISKFSLCFIIMMRERERQSPKYPYFGLLAYIHKMVTMLSWCLHTTNDVTEWWKPFVHMLKSESLYIFNGFTLHI